MLLGLLFLATGLFIPAHFRGVDVKIVEWAGRGTTPLVEASADLLKAGRIGAARMLSRTADLLQLPGSDLLSNSVAQVSLSPVGIGKAGDLNLPVVNELFAPSNSTPVIELMMDPPIRNRVIQSLPLSRRPGVRDILNTRTLTNTVQFAPVSSPAGQPLEAVIALTGILAQTERMSSNLRDRLEFLAFQANRGLGIQPLESAYLDILSLGKRLDAQQTGDLLQRIEDLADLHAFGEAARAADKKFQFIYSGTLLSDQAHLMAQYVKRYPQAADEVRTALASGKGGVVELLKRQQRIYAPKWRLFLADYDPFGGFFYGLVPLCQALPGLSLAVRCSLFIIAAFCIARAIGTVTLHPFGDGLAATDNTRLLQEGVIALCICTVAIICAEPFLLSNPPPAAAISRPRAGKSPGASASPVRKTIRPSMTTANVVPLVIFFVLQALLYIWSLAKLAEIRRQPADPRLKLRLIENEDHLFDAGLYLGFVGTVISLILVSLGIIEQSIMAAYASTSFGIIFVSILKIFHIRPLRRQLILETEKPA